MMAYVSKMQVMRHRYPSLCACLYTQVRDCIVISNGVPDSAVAEEIWWYTQSFHSRGDSIEA